MNIELKREEPVEAIKGEKSKEAPGDQVPVIGHAWPTEDQPYYDHLTPTEIEPFRAFETVRVQNTYLTREVILLEEQNIALRSVNRRLDYLVKLKCEAATTPSSSPTPPPSSSPKKET